MSFLTSDHLSSWTMAVYVSSCHQSSWSTDRRRVTVILKLWSSWALWAPSPHQCSPRTPELLGSTCPFFLPIMPVPTSNGCISSMQPFEGMLFSQIRLRSNQLYHDNAAGGGAICGPAPCVTSLTVMSGQALWKNEWWDLRYERSKTTTVEDKALYNQGRVIAQIILKPKQASQNIQVLIPSVKLMERYQAV